MAVPKLARYVVRPDARDEAERVLHELASVVRAAVPKVMTTTWRETHAPNHYVTLLVDSSAAIEQMFRDALAPLLEGTIDFFEHQLVTSSELAPRPRDPTRGSRRRPR